MTVYCYLQVKPISSIQFASPLSNWLKAAVPQCTSIALDNHSETFLINHAAQSVSEAKEVILHLEVEQGLAPGGLMVIFEALRKKKPPVLIYLDGTNPTVEKILRILPQQEQVINLNALKKAIITLGSRIDQHPGEQGTYA